MSFFAFKKKKKQDISGTDVYESTCLSSRALHVLSARGLNLDHMFIIHQTANCKQQYEPVILKESTDAFLCAFFWGEIGFISYPSIFY